MPLSNLAVRDIETVVHPYTNLAGLRDSGPLVIEHGKGVFIHDSEGKAYIDGMAGLWCVSLGYGNEELVEAAATQMRKLSFGHLFSAKSHDPAVELAEKLKEIAPVPISKVFFCSSGSEANDSQVKLVWYMNNALGRPNKKKIISRLRGYHGVTVAAASLTGLPNNHIDFDLPIPNILHTSCPHHYRFAHEGESEQAFASRLAAELDELIVREGPDTVAAFFVEPVMGAGGVLVPPAGYFEKVLAVCARHDVYVVSDEVICCFGRLGTMFGCQAFGFAPDSTTVAKALTSAYVPMAALTVPERMYQAMLDESRKIGTFGHGFTYTGHPVCAAVALRTIELYQQRDIVGHVRRVAPHFQKRLARLGEHAERRRQRRPRPPTPRPRPRSHGPQRHSASGRSRHRRRRWPRWPHHHRHQHGRTRHRHSPRQRRRRTRRLASDGHRTPRFRTRRSPTLRPQRPSG